MSGIVGLGIPLPRDRRKPTLREIARLLIVAREIEKMHIHATADNCPAHDRITAPAAREYARLDDA